MFAQSEWSQSYNSLVFSQNSLIRENKASQYNNQILLNVKCVILNQAQFGMAPNTYFAESPKPNPNYMWSRPDVAEHTLVVNSSLLSDEESRFYFLILLLHLF